MAQVLLDDSEDSAYLRRVYCFQRLEILQNDFEGQLSPSQGNDLHGFAEMSSSSIRCLNAGAKEILKPLDDYRCMIDCIDLET